MRNQMKTAYCLLAFWTLVFLPGAFAQSQTTPNPLVGTWEFVSARTADGKECPEYARIFKNVRGMTMITPTHCVYFLIEPATGKIILVHGGRCLLGNGEMTEWREYSSDLSMLQGAKVFRSKVRFVGDTFVKTLESGTQETWRRASAAKASAGSTLGQELIDLQRAKEAGAITDAEYKALRAKLLERK